MLDEPTNHLDMESIDSLVEAIEVFDGAVIIVTHSEMILNAMATKLIVFDRGSVSVFDGTYQEFLERVGWDDEGGVKAPKQKKREQEKGGNRKDAKKLRAGLVNDKSRVLSSLKSRITALEEEITKLEFDVEQDTQKLLEASLKGEALSIKRLSQAVRDNKARIDARFAELQTVTSEHDEKAKEFDLQLNELAQIS